MATSWLDTDKGVRAEILQYVHKASIRKDLERTLILDSPPMVITQIVGSTHGQLQLFLQVP